MWRTKRPTASCRESRGAVDTYTELSVPFIMAMRQNILVTGGTGYIGSHTLIELLAAGHSVLVIDNLCNSKASVLDRIERIAGRRPGFAQIDVRDRSALRRLFAEHRFDAVLHFAG